MSGRGVALVPLICDPPPGGLWVVECDELLTPQAVERIKEIVRGSIVTGLLVLPPGFRIRHIDASPGWPDWEHSAA